MVIVILILLGVCFGSFANALVWRLHEQAELADKRVDLQTRLKALQASQKPQSKRSAQAQQVSLSKQIAELEVDATRLSISKGRSMCVHCRHELAAKDLVPILSFVFLRGKCRYCGRAIQDTPLAELLTPALFVLSYVAWPFALHASTGSAGQGLFVFCLWLVFLVGFVALALYDLRWYELPHIIVLPLIGLALVQVVVTATIFGGGKDTLLHALWGGLFGGGLFYLLYALSPKQNLPDGERISAWIGGGDITLGLLLGVLVGGPGNALLLIFIASLIGTVVALPLLLAGKATRTSQLPFGPYLLAGAVVALLWGARLIAWYTGQFV